MSDLKIGALARRSGLSVEALRYYERRGLIPPPARLPSGYRVFPVETLDRLAFIKRSKELGFTLDEIRDLLELQAHPEADSAGVKQRVEARIDEIERKIEDLQRIQQALRGLSSLCSGQGSTANCPILAFLEQDEPADVPGSRES
ncbi:heavy metal-responsive transcriptional regulator [Marinobacterium weihaiense]|uniref:Heavy metal-responsive transcriptional regulator n=1 Tax=Marinobacterium weihaiense TaxID=2851016 RepID=A0ABS6MCE9_9GAMM|nr:heavy metal-responsive transcriptional regulator [Marinobacterium weihaiense]MBV0933959.1 heavy metal-responsive transcriptional regulator [Marinobacterium weihaiense]